MNTLHLWIASVPANALGLALIDAAIKSSALLALALVASVALRKASAASRHAWWCGTFAGVLLLPLLSLALPGWRVSWLPHGESPAQAVATAAPKDTLVSVAPTDPIAFTTEASGSRAMSPISNSGVTRGVPPSVKPIGAEELAESPGLGLEQTALLVWAGGALLALLPMLAGWWQASRLTARGRRLNDPEWDRLLAEATCSTGLRRPVRLLAAPGVTMPFMWGWWRPAVLFPEDADRWPESRRRFVLLHELGHIARGDCLAQSLGGLACGLYWFNPLAWWAARQMQLEREQACDDLVLRCHAEARAYARELVDIAAHSSRGLLLGQATVPMARLSTLETRLRAILDGKRSHRRMSRGVALAMVSILAATIVPLAMLRGAAGESGNGLTPLQAAENSVVGVFNLARSQASLTRQPVRVLIFDDFSTPDNLTHYLCRFLIVAPDPKVPNDWLPLGGAPVDLPPGIFVLSQGPTIPNHLPGNVWWPVNRWSQFSHLPISVTVNGISTMYYYIEFNALGAIDIPQNRNVAGYPGEIIALAEANLRQPGDLTEPNIINFKNPDNINGVRVSIHGAIIQLNDAKGFSF